MKTPDQPAHPLTRDQQLLNAARAEITRLRAEVERFKGWLADPHAVHSHCLRTLNDGQIAHLFGERMTEVANRAEKAEAALAFIAENGGTTHETECGTISCNGSWCAEQARAAMKAEAALTSPPLLTGKLTHAGLCNIGEEHVDGVFIAIDREQIKALSRLPMYEQIELRVAMKNEITTP
jgi:hypothetical protein